MWQRQVGTGGYWVGQSACTRLLVSSWGRVSRCFPHTAFGSLPLQVMILPRDYVAGSVWHAAQERRRDDPVLRVHQARGLCSAALDAKPEGVAVWQVCSGLAKNPRTQDSLPALPGPRCMPVCVWPGSCISHTPGAGTGSQVLSSSSHGAGKMNGPFPSQVVDWKRRDFEVQVATSKGGHML